MNTIKKRLRRIPWTFYLPLLALLLWTMIGGFYLGLWGCCPWAVPLAQFPWILTI